MNAKCRAKCRARLAGALLLAVWPILQYVTADDGNLIQQLRIQQHMSRFQLMLEQVQARARQRLATGQAVTPRAGSLSPTDAGDWTPSLGLDPITVSKPAMPRIDADATLRLGARQAHERDQRRILDHRQQRRALTAGAHTLGAMRADSFQVKRRELVRFNAQIQRQTLQRKLRP
jgi:hypothetical protein